MTAVTTTTSIAWMLAGTLLLAPAAPLAAQASWLEVGDGQEISVHRYPGNGRGRVLWLPSERGLRAGHQPLAERLAALGHDVWVADLHTSYFVQPGRDSLGEFPIEHLVALIAAAGSTAADGIFLMSESRGAQLALLAARAWQLANPGQRSLRGLLLIHPNLFAERPDPGDPGRYLPVAYASNLPMYLFEAEYSTGYQHLSELSAALGAGGAAVFVQRLAGVRGGFHLRPDADLQPLDLDARAALPGTLDRAIALLGTQPLPERAGGGAIEMQPYAATRPRAELAALARPRAAPALALWDTEGRRRGLDDYLGKTVLVNFWASWCAPCVHEIPSLNRLRRQLRDQPFEILAVNIGETAATVAEFRQQVPLDMPVLLDRDGQATRDWRVYVYPSNFLVDADGRIRNAHLGALQWDRPDLVSMIRAALPREGDTR